MAVRLVAEPNRAEKVPVYVFWVVTVPLNVPGAPDVLLSTPAKVPAVASVPWMNSWSPSSNSSFFDVSLNVARVASSPLRVALTVTGISCLAATACCSFTMLSSLLHDVAIMPKATATGSAKVFRIFFAFIVLLFLLLILGTPELYKSSSVHSSFIVAFALACSSWLVTCSSTTSEVGWTYVRLVFLIIVSFLLI